MKYISMIPVAVGSFLSFCLVSQNVSAIKYSPSQTLVLAEDSFSPPETSPEREHQVTIRDNSAFGGQGLQTTSALKQSKRVKRSKKSTKKRASRSKKTGRPTLNLKLPI